MIHPLLESGRNFKKHLFYESRFFFFFFQMRGLKARLALVSDLVPPSSSLHSQSQRSPRGILVLVFFCKHRVLKSPLAKALIYTLQPPHPTEHTLYSLQCLSFNNMPLWNTSFSILPILVLHEIIKSVSQKYLQVVCRAGLTLLSFLFVYWDFKNIYIFIVHLLVHAPSSFNGAPQWCFHESYQVKDGLPTRTVGSSFMGFARKPIKDDNFQKSTCNTAIIIPIHVLTHLSASLLLVSYKCPFSL